MLEAISKKDWQQLPQEAQREVLDFFLFIKNKYDQQAKATAKETALLSEQALAEDWLKPEEDEAWADFQ